MIDLPDKLTFDQIAKEPRQLLEAIEKDPDSFTQGNRNNDVVNWCLASIMVYNVENENAETKVIGLNDMVNGFEDMVEGLSAVQRDDMLYWDDEADEKIAACHRLYSGKDNLYLARKLIDRGGYAGFEY